MGLFAKIAGVVGSFFQVGGPSGPGLANDGGSGNLGAYNSGQSAYINVRGADPVANNDFVTLEYANAHYSSGSSTTYGSVPASTTLDVPVGTVYVTADNLTIPASSNITVEGVLAMVL
jgi:hypothetical protein